MGKIFPATTGLRHEVADWAVTSIVYLSYFTIPKHTDTKLPYSLSQYAQWRILFQKQLVCNMK